MTDTDRTIAFLNFDGQPEAIFMRLHPNRWWGGKTADRVNLPGIFQAHQIVTDYTLLQIIGDIAVTWPGDYRITVAGSPDFTTISRTMDARVLSQVLDIPVEMLTEYYGHAINIAQERAAAHEPPHLVPDDTRVLVAADTAAAEE